MKSHYERVICLCCFLIFFTNVGLPSTSFNVFQPYIASLPAIGNTGGSVILAVRTLVSLVCMFFVARYVGRLGARKGASLAALFTAVGFFLYSFASDYPGFFAGAVFAGAGYGLGGMVIVTLVTRHWFKAGVGKAVGIATMGSGVSSMLLSPITARVIEGFGLEWGFRLEAIIALCVSGILIALLRDRPEDLGMQPYEGKEAQSSGASGGQVAESSDNGKRAAENHAAASTPLSRGSMALLIVGVVCLGCVTIDAYNYFSILLTSQGHDTMFAATTVAILGGALTVGKFASGVVIDRIGTLRGTIILYAMIILGLLCCCLSGAGSSVAVVAAVLYGAGATLGSVGISLWAMEFATQGALTKMVKNLQVSYALGGFIFSIVPGPLADLTGSYVPAYVIFLCLAVASAIIVVRTYLRCRS